MELLQTQTTLLATLKTRRSNVWTSTATSQLFGMMARLKALHPGRGCFLHCVVQEEVCRYRTKSECEPRSQEVCQQVNFPKIYSDLSAGFALIGQHLESQESVTF